MKLFEKIHKMAWLRKLKSKLSVRLILVSHLLRSFNPFNRWTWRSSHIPNSIPYHNMIDSSIGSSLNVEECPFLQARCRFRRKVQNGFCETWKLMSVMVGYHLVDWILLSLLSVRLVDEYYSESWVVSWEWIEVSSNSWSINGICLFFRL